MVFLQKHLLRGDDFGQGPGGGEARFQPALVQNLDEPGKGLLQVGGRAEEAEVFQVKRAQIQRDVRPRNRAPRHVPPAAFQEREVFGEPFVPHHIGDQAEPASTCCGQRCTDVIWRCPVDGVVGADGAYLVCLGGAADGHDPGPVVFGELDQKGARPARPSASCSSPSRRNRATSRAARR